ncbi:MAG: hypothetical protein GF331_02900, partial [Chitinivibrionales bacterium]|nr:hypothetical protein [Chitinivibrionales bacterium]
MAPVVAFLLCSALSLAAQTLIHPDHEHIRYVGRVDFTNVKQPRFDWPGVYFETRFEGTSLGLRFDRGNSDLDVYIDGDSVATIDEGGGELTFDIAAGLADTLHDLLVSKRNEGGAVVFYGLVLDDGKGLVAPAPRLQRRFEFLGDSYVACYGCESRVTECTDVGAYTDAYDSYAAQTSRALGAEYSLIAMSGRGLLHNAGDPMLVSVDNVPSHYDRTLKSYPTPAWDFAVWVPDIVVIALGVNDLRDPAVPVPRDTFTTHYRQLIARIQTNYPGVDIVCASYAWPDSLQPFVEHVYDL